MPKTYDIVGYTYGADLWCPHCIAQVLTGNEADDFYRAALELNPSLAAETVLDRIAEQRGIDRQVEESFDSGDFPKVVFRDMLDSNEQCGNCGAVLDA